LRWTKTTSGEKKGNKRINQVSRNEPKKTTWKGLREKCAEKDKKTKTSKRQGTKRTPHFALGSGRTQKQGCLVDEVRIVSLEKSKGRIPRNAKNQVPAKNAEPPGVKINEGRSKNVNWKRTGRDRRRSVVQTGGRRGRECGAGGGEKKDDKKRRRPKDQKAGDRREQKTKKPAGTMTG